VTPSAKRSQINNFISAKFSRTNVVDVASFKRDGCSAVSAFSSITLENSLARFAPNFFWLSALGHLETLT
jgi:hypothetical protein